MSPFSISLSHNHKDKKKKGPVGAKEKIRLAMEMQRGGANELRSGGHKGKEQDAPAPKTAAAPSKPAAPASQSKPAEPARVEPLRRAQIA